MPRMLPGVDHAQPLSWDFAPLEALRRWPLERRLLCLHSGRFDPRWARWSVLAEPAGKYRFVADLGDGQSHWAGPANLLPPDQFTHRPFHDLRLLLQLPGVWIGYLSYDLGRWIEKLPAHAAADRAWPIIELTYCPGYLAYDHQQRRWLACGDWADRTLLDLLSQATSNQQPANIPAAFSVANLRSNFTRAQYESAVQHALAYIAAGDIFQVNLAQRFTADGAGAYPAAHRDLFQRLMEISPAWYGAYLELSDQRVLASISPELFLEVAAGHVITRPIKGTRPASVCAEELRTSAKDIAELNMIVDLLRNDLGRVCAYGSVQVTQARQIETHPTVHHGVATIAGRLHPNKDLVDLLRATLPGGSITGAPKVRAMQIIDQLEPARRGPYCGCLGWLTRDAACLNIAIRTLLIEPRSAETKPAAAESGPSLPTTASRLDFSVGGGIVADSAPADEYEETLDKARALLAALGLENTK